jgi:hypothetical protein
MLLVARFGHAPSRPTMVKPSMTVVAPTPLTVSEPR